MEIRKGDIVELTIEKLVYGGRGISHLNNVAIFVDKVAPGDRIASRVLRVKRNYAESRVIKMIEPSPHRIAAPCDYSDYCGGCKWQFITYDKQLEYKRLVIEELLEHIGKTSDFRLHPVLPCSKIFGYRNKMEFSFSDRRWLSPEEKEAQVDDTYVALGLHVPGTFNKIIDIEGCLLQEERGNEIMQAVKREVRRSNIPVYGLTSHQGFWRYLMLRHSYHFDTWMVNIVTSEMKESATRELAHVLKEKFGGISSIVNNVNTKKGGTATGEFEKAVFGERFIRDKIGPFTFEISANSFFQTNTAMAEKLYHTVNSFASLTGKETVLNLYSGAGTDSIFLAPYASRIIGIDISNDSIKNAKKNCQINGIDNCEFLCGDVKTVLSHISNHIDIIIVDPPRAGMHKKVVEQILSMLPEKIVYVSCNPSTLARDVALLSDQYRVKEIQPIDLFPHTYHIESVVRLQKR